MTKPVYSRSSRCQVLKMKVSVTLLSFVSFTNLVVNVRSETINCKVIPFETKEGLSGTCCVVFKNTSAGGGHAFPNEEVTRQIMDKTNAADKNTPKEAPKNDDERLVFTDARRYDHKHKEKQGAARNENTPKESEPKQMTGRNDTWTEKKNVTIATKNAFDTPSNCPEGQLKDHTGACMEPF